MMISLGSIESKIENNSSFILNIHLALSCIWMAQRRLCERWHDKCVDGSTKFCFYYDYQGLLNACDAFTPEIEIECVALCVRTTKNCYMLLHKWNVRCFCSTHALIHFWTSQLTHFSYKYDDFFFMFVPSFVVYVLIYIPYRMCAQGFKELFEFLFGCSCTALETGTTNRTLRRTLSTYTWHNTLRHLNVAFEPRRWWSPFVLRCIPLISIHAISIFPLSVSLCFSHFFCQFQ